MRDEVYLNMATSSTQSSYHNINKEEGVGGHMPVVLEGYETMSSDSNEELNDNVENNSSSLGFPKVYKYRRTYGFVKLTLHLLYYSRMGCRG